MSPNLEQLTAEFTALVGALTPVAGLAEAGQPGSPTPATDATPLAPAPVQTCDHALKGYHFSATVPAGEVVAAAEILDRAGFALDAITGVDWIAQNEMEVVYDFFHHTSPLRVVVRARVPRAEPELPTISTAFPGANWHERETHDFFGIRFTGHPNLKPFLLPEDADFHPLRKDYQP
jgi:NADH-quinone oxidoreductase subunit C